MLEIIDRAETAIKILVAIQSAVDSEVANPRIRICPSEPTGSSDGAARRQTALRLDLVTEPDPGDELVVGPEGRKS
jgi:hypothetical protein